MKIVQHLNWNLQAYKDREDMVKGLIEDGMLDELSPYQINEVANYLLYASDIEAEVKLRNPTKKMVSYEELVDTGVAESAMNRRNFSIYKNVKPSIDREVDKDIPGMQELWEAIDNIKVKYDYVRDCVKGIREPDFDNPIVPTFVLHNFYRSWYIDLCRNQYYLKDIFKPVVCSTPSFGGYYSKPGLFGICVGDCILAEHEHMIDLGNSEHVYQLLKQYTNIKEKHLEEMDDDWNCIYDILDNIIARINWSDTHWTILEMKINNHSNEEVSDFIFKKYGIHYSINYISTIYRRHISRDIAKEANIMAQEWEKRNNPECWKVCSRCETKRFNSTKNFGKNKKVCLYCTGKRKGVGRKIKIEVVNNGETKDSKRKD